MKKKLEPLPALPATLPLFGEHDLASLLMRGVACAVAPVLGRMFQRAGERAAEKKLLKRIVALAKNRNVVGCRVVAEDRLKEILRAERAEDLEKATPRPRAS